MAWCQYLDLEENVSILGKTHICVLVNTTGPVIIVQADLNQSYLFWAPLKRLFTCNCMSLGNLLKDHKPRIALIKRSINLLELRYRDCLCIHHVYRTFWSSSSERQFLLSFLKINVFFISNRNIIVLKHYFYGTTGSLLSKGIRKVSKSIAARLKGILFFPPYLNTLQAMILNLNSVVNFGSKWKKTFARGLNGRMSRNNRITSTFPTGQSQGRVVNRSISLFLGVGGDMPTKGYTVHGTSVHSDSFRFSLWAYP